MTDIAAYIAANDVTVHDADDAVVWAQTAAWEMIVWIEDSGRFSNPFTSVIYELIRQELKIACSNDSLNCPRKWYEHKAMSLGQSVEEMTSITMSSEAQLGLEALQLFGEAMVAYNLIPMPVGGDNGSWFLDRSQGDRGFLSVVDSLGWWRSTGVLPGPIQRSTAFGIMANLLTFKALSFSHAFGTFLWGQLL